MQFERLSQSQNNESVMSNLRIEKAMLKAANTCKDHNSQDSTVSCLGPNMYNTKTEVDSSKHNSSIP